MEEQTWYLGFSSFLHLLGFLTRLSSPFSFVDSSHTDARPGHRRVSLFVLLLYSPSVSQHLYGGRTVRATKSCSGVRVDKGAVMAW